MPLVAIAGYQNSGKTTLVERLVEDLSGRGSTATMKSIHHDVEVDTPGKDTHRHRMAGADAVVGLTPSLSFQIRVEETTERADGDERLHRGLDLLEREYDYVVAEGFKTADVPTILVGDIEESAVAGRILARVEDPETVDISSLVDAIESSAADL